MKNVNQIHNIKNALACRAKAATVRAGIDEDYSAIVAVKMRAVAQQWDDLAADYETSILNCVTRDLR
jgi:hypothetical protein